MQKPVDILSFLSHHTKMMKTYFTSFMFFIFLAPAMAITDHDLIRLAGYGEERLSTVFVSGTLLCDDARNSHHPIPGASVAIRCHADRKTRKLNIIRAKTDEYGNFVVDLPSHLHAIQDMEKRCRVRIVRVPNKSPCHRAAARSKHIVRIKLSSSGNGVRTYSTHNIHLTRKYSGKRTHMYVA